MVGPLEGSLSHFTFLNSNTNDAVHDLPQLYQKPSAAALLHALELLLFSPTSFSGPVREVSGRPRVAEQGVPSYLTSIVSSNLAWIEDEDAKESIWSAASARLSERSGRNAMPAMTRSFIIGQDPGCQDLVIQLHEPTLTEDNLGLKTWTSSLLLSRRLREMRRLIPGTFDRVLELGAGTGLVGISAACLWKTHVLLTDLPEIVPNLQQNLEQNKELVREHYGSVESRALDWADDTDTPSSEQVKFDVILAADPIYSPEHPNMLVTTVRRWIRWEADARFIVELPLRDRYDEERQALRNILVELDFSMVTEGTDVGHDDWRGRDGSPAEVTCWWSIWRPNIPLSEPL
ncbi:hypothetical protein PV04_02654 [Phialophora macrospora]|uniref:Glucose-inducible SAM-dependent methyltransferase Rrg1 n=1 Tax=Phialophora macrospora TaxID=1851006 RepID=A0A0D2FV53_9EURO|nr:hypothetical protein PV04_02654 [Phialophora macrospora]